MNIRLLHNNEIDFKLWDTLILSSPKSSIFHFSWFLELIDDDWYALIANDYNWVFPFFVQKKQVYFPQLIPYLGIVSSKTLSVDEFESILEFWNKNFVSIDYHFSKYQYKFSQDPLFIPSPYFQKDLIKRYNNIAKTFSPEVKQNLDIANNNQLRCISLRSLFNFISFIKEYSNYSMDEIKTIQKIILRATRLKRGKMYSIYNKKNELSAVAFLLFSKSKAYIMYTAYAPEAKKERADYKMINTIIEELCLYNITLENHSHNNKSQIFEAFNFKSYHSYQYQHHTKQNLLSLLQQFLKRN